MKRRKAFAGGGSTIPYLDRGFNPTPGAAPLAGSAPIAITGWSAPSAADRRKIMLGPIMDKLEGAKGLIPYASNILNSFRKVPAPTAPVLSDTISPEHVDYSAERAEADRKMRGQNLGADQTLDENTAAAVKATNLASDIRAKNAVNEQEMNTNAQLRGQTARVNAGIQARNNALTNQYHQQQTAAQIAQQRATSENEANAADKYIMQENEQAKRDLELKKLGVLSQTWKNSGVFSRLMQNLNKEGILQPDEYPVHAYGGRVKAFGGIMGPGDEPEPSKPAMSEQEIYNNYYDQLKAQGNKDAARIAAVYSMAHKYGVSPASIYTSTDYNYDGTTPRQRTFTIQESGKPVRIIVKSLAGDAAGSSGNTFTGHTVHSTAGQVASFASGGYVGATSEDVQSLNAPWKKYDSLSFGKAFQAARHDMDRGKVFEWRGKWYTTNYATEEKKTNQAKKQVKSASADEKKAPHETSTPTPAPAAFRGRNPSIIDWDNTTRRGPAPVSASVQTPAPVNPTMDTTGYRGQSVPIIDWNVGNWQHTESAIFPAAPPPAPEAPVASDNMIMPDNTGVKMANGGSIHIKPSHRGRFNAFKKRTGETTEQALHSKNPHVREMANFARNSSHWNNHAYGGRTKAF